MSAAGDSPSYVIRSAQIGDREAVVDLYLAVHTELYAPPSLDVTAYIAEKRQRSRQGPWRTRGIHVVEMSGRIVGFVEVVYDLVNALYVDRRMRGRGIGGALLAVAERELQAKGVAIARLRVACDRAEIVEFYARHGWLVAKDAGTDEPWGIKLQEMTKQLVQEDSLVPTVLWPVFKLGLAVLALSLLVLFGMGLHYAVHLPAGMIAIAFLFVGMLIGRQILRTPKLNLKLTRSCLVGLTNVGCHLLMLMAGAGAAGLALNLIGITGLERGNASFLGPISLFLMSYFAASYAHRLARPICLRLL